jgi:hypothetical protein
LVTQRFGDGDVGVTAREQGAAFISHSGGGL